MKRLLVAAMVLLVAACTTTDTRVAAENMPRPAAGSRILLVQPDVELAMLTVTGLQEAKADWSQTARDNIASRLQAEMQERAHTYKQLPADAPMEGRVGQVLRLHTAVADSIRLISFGFIQLPTKKGAFDWTIGEGAQEVAAAHEVDYALFTYARGTYSSGARMALAILGGTSTGAGQFVYCSLVDLKTGRIVWANQVVAGGADMRDAQGVVTLVDALLKDAPL